jgi:hypothetical protein
MSNAGFNSSIYIGGTATAATGEACTSLGGDAWQITSAAKRVWDPDTVPSFTDNGTPIDPADIDSIDYLFGIVQFNTSPVGPIVVDMEYIPLLEIASGYNFTVDMNVDVLDATVFGDAAYRRIPGLKMASGSFEIWDVTSTDLDPGAGSRVLDAVFQGRTLVLFSVTATSAWIFRCWGYVSKLTTGAGVADLVGSTIDFVSTSRSDGNGQNTNFSVS